jgi:UDP-galactopyranose mutase
MIYDFLIVGAGLFGSTFAQKAKESGKKCLIIDSRNHIGGNIYTENKEGINIHKYGPHIFHTNNDEIWNYVNKFTKFNNYINRPKVNFKNKIFSFPINLFTLYQLWGVDTPELAKNKLEEVKIKISQPNNLEEWILSQVGEEIYHTFIYGYTKKQWGREPKELPSFIIKRLPIRLNFDDNYFFDKYQGVPIDGYTKIIENMTEGIDIVLNENYFDKRDYWNKKAKSIVYTGKIDEFFDYKYGELEYRSLKFETQKHSIKDYQGNAIMNYTEYDIPYTRIIEHKHFEFGNQDYTYITKEYPDSWNRNKTPYYPINNEENNYKYNKYKNLSEKTNITFGGRLAEYKYYDMHQIIGSALQKIKNIDNIT